MISKLYSYLYVGLAFGLMAQQSSATPIHPYPESDALFQRVEGLRRSEFGRSLDLGDFNNDGKAELLIGAPLTGHIENQTGPGAIYSAQFSNSGLPMPPPFSIDPSMLGGTGVSLTGLQVRFLGYGNRNRMPELGSASPNQLCPNDLSSPLGTVRVFYDAPNANHNQLPASLSACGATANGGFGGEGLAGGSSFAALGDLDNDGRGDFIIGERLSTIGGINAGSAYVFSGRSLTPLFVHHGILGSELGTSVGVIGDITGDGKREYMISAPREALSGKVYIYSGGSGQLLHTVSGAINQQGLGYENIGSNLPYRPLGDLNCDGVPDILIASARATAPGGAHNGAIRIISGAAARQGITETLHLMIGGAGTSLGRAATPAGDINSDGYADFAVSSSENRGTVRLVSGWNGQTIYTLSQGGDVYTGFGQALLADRDLNNDGIPELVIGRPIPYQPASLDLRPDVLIYDGAFFSRNDASEAAPMQCSNRTQPEIS